MVLVLSVILMCSALHAFVSCFRDRTCIIILFLIQRQSSEIRQSIVQKYVEMHAVLDEDLGITLSHLEMEEKAAAFALETLMERNGYLIQEIEQDLSTLDEALDHTDTQTNIMVMMT